MTSKQNLSKLRSVAAAQQEESKVATNLQHERSFSFQERSMVSGSAMSIKTEQSIVDRFIELSQRNELFDPIKGLTKEELQLAMKELEALKRAKE